MYECMPMQIPSDNLYVQRCVSSGAVDRLSIYFLCGMCLSLFPFLSLFLSFFVCWCVHGNLSGDRKLTQNTWEPTANFKIRFYFRIIIRLVYSKYIVKMYYEFVLLLPLRRFLFTVCIGSDALCARNSVFDFLFCDSHADDDIFLSSSLSQSALILCVPFFTVHKLNIGKFWTASNARCYNNRFQLSWQIHSMRLKTPQIWKTFVLSLLFSFRFFPLYETDLRNRVWGLIWLCDFGKLETKNTRKHARAIVRMNAQQ